MKPLPEQTPSCRQARGAGDGLPVERAQGVVLISIQLCLSDFPAAPAPSSSHLVPPPPHPPTQRALIRYVSLHTFGRCIHYFVSLFTYLPSLVPFFAHCLGCTISALFSSNSPPLAKGLPLQGQTLSSETWFPGTEIMESALGCIQGRLERVGRAWKHQPCLVLEIQCSRLEPEEDKELRGGRKQLL